MAGQQREGEPCGDHGLTRTTGTDNHEAMRRHAVVQADDAVDVVRRFRRRATGRGLSNRFPLVDAVPLTVPSHRHPDRSPVDIAQEDVQLGSYSVPQPLNRPPTHAIVSPDDGGPEVNILLHMVGGYAPALYVASHSNRGAAGRTHLLLLPRRGVLLIRHRVDPSLVPVIRVRIRAELLPPMATAPGADAVTPEPVDGAMPLSGATGPEPS